MTTLTQIRRDAGWLERSSTVTIFLVLGLCVGAWAAAIPTLKIDLGLDDRGLSIALLALAIGSVLATVATGALAPRFGTGRSTGAAALVTVAAFLLPVWASGLVGLCVVTFVMGLGCGALDVSMNAHAGDIERRWRSPIMSSFHAAFSLGGLLGAALGGLLASAGWSLAGQLWVPLGVAGLLVVGSLAGLGGGARSAEGHGSGLAWPERAALGVCAIALLCFMIEGAMADWSGVYLLTVAGSSTGVAAAGYAAFSIAMLAGRLVGDRVVAAAGAARVVFYGGFLAAIGMALAVALPHPSIVALGFALVGLGAANVVPVAISAAARFGTSPSAGVAMVATVGYAGFLGGPPLIGAVATVADLRVALGLLMVAAGVVAWLGLALRRSEAG